MLWEIWDSSQQSVHFDCQLTGKWWVRGMDFDMGRIPKAGGDQKLGAFPYAKHGNHGAGI